METVELITKLATMITAIVGLIRELLRDQLSFCQELFLSKKVIYGREKIVPGGASAPRPPPPAAEQRKQKAVIAAPQPP